MTISMFEASVPRFAAQLNALSNVLDKAAKHAEANKIGADVLPSSRLYPDMFPLTRQVQIACDFAKGCAARLAGDAVPKVDDSETTFGELKVRIEQTIAYLDTFSASRIDGSEAREISLTVGGSEMRFSGKDYLLGFVLPNFYFHVVTAYDILRHNGVVIGKRDFLGVS